MTKCLFGEEDCTSPTHAELGRIRVRRCHWCDETATVEWREHDFTERACAFHADKWCPTGYVRHAV